MNIDKQSVAEFHVGNGTVGATAQKITDLEFPAYHKVMVEAASGNGGTVYVGSGSNVSASNGWPLAAGENVDIPVDATTKVWVIGSGPGQDYKWLAV